MSEKELQVLFEKEKKMASEIYFFLVLVFGGFALVIFFINRQLEKIKEVSKPDQTLTEWLKSMQSSLEGTSKVLNEALRTSNKNLTDTLQKSTKALNERLDNAAKFIAQVAKEVGRMSELGKAMRDLQVFLQ